MRSPRSKLIVSHLALVQSSDHECHTEKKLLQCKSMKAMKNILHM